MTKYNLIKILPTLVFLTLIVFCCKKNNDKMEIEGDIQGDIYILKNSSLANSNDTLQAKYISYDNKLKMYYYGSYNSNGEPEKLKEMVVDYYENNDTLLNIIFDDSSRIKSIFLSKNGIIAKQLLTFDYSLLDKTIMNLHYYNFDNDSSKLVQQYTVNNTSKILESKVSNASFGSGLSQILLQIQPAFKRSNSYLAKLAASTNAGVLIFAVTTAAGCATGFLVNPTLTAVGCRIGAAIGAMTGVSLTANANEINITDIPANTPKSPINQTQNTQFQNKHYFVGTMPTSGVVPFGGNPYCNYTVEYTNTALEIKLNSNNLITNANISATMNEIVLTPNCYSGNNNWVKKNYYTLHSGNISGNNVSISFINNQNNFPKNITTFMGTKVGNKISGTIKMIRNHDMNCIVTIPITMNLVN